MSALSGATNQSDHDDLEYNITFPTVPNGDSDAVVFLLGWLGSKDKHLAKYSAIYENENCTTIRYIHPFRNVLFTDPAQSDEHAKAAYKLAQLLDDFDLMTNPVFIHVFSQGGFFVYRHLADALQEKDIKVAGAVFDSCPSRTDLVVGLRAMVSSGIIPNRLASLLFAVAFTIFYLILRVKSFLGLINRVDPYQVTLNSKRHNWPHLFLYSSADVIVPQTHIAEMVEGRKEAGVSLVKHFDFKTSPHVLHFKRFPNVYKGQCIMFLQSCLKMFEDSNLTAVSDDDHKQITKSDSEDVADDGDQK